MSGALSSYAAADTRYVAAYQPEAMPSRLRLACALADTVWNPDPERMTVLDLGCGRGLTACLLAAANPGWDVVGLDLQPAHVAEAREMAAEAGIDNARFLEADLAAMDEATVERLLPEADLVVLWGVWTWVPDSVRQGIVRLLRSRLKPGGLALVGYNALPGFADSIVVQRLLQEAASGARGAESERAMSAVSTVAALVEAKPVPLYLPRPEVMKGIEEAGRKTPSYLAHEYLTGFWRPVFAKDLARDLAQANLDFVGPAQPAEAMPHLQMTPEQRAAIAAAPPWMDRELLTDLFLMRRFRRDVFVRGRRPGGRLALRDMRFALAVSPEGAEFSLDTQTGKAALPEASQQAVLATLSEGPRTLGELAAAPGVGAGEADLGLMLAETGVASPLWREPSRSPEAMARAARCNAVLLRRLAREAAASGSPLGLVAPAIGGALPISASDLAVAVALQDGAPADAAALATRLLPRDHTSDHRRVAEESIQRLLDHRLIGWRSLGAV